MHQILVSCLFSNLNWWKWILVWWNGPTASPPQDPAERISQRCGASVKIQFKNGELRPRDGKSKTRECVHGWACRHTWRGCSLWRSHAGAEEASTREGAAGKSEQQVVEGVGCVCPEPNLQHCLLPHQTEHNLQG